MPFRKKTLEEVLVMRHSASAADAAFQDREAQRPFTTESKVSRSVDVHRMRRPRSVGGASSPLHRLYTLDVKHVDGSGSVKNTPTYGGWSNGAEEEINWRQGAETGGAGGRLGEGVESKFRGQAPGGGGVWLSDSELSSIMEQVQALQLRVRKLEAENVALQLPEKQGRAVVETTSRERTTIANLSGAPTPSHSSSSSPTSSSLTGPKLRKSERHQLRQLSRHAGILSNSLEEVSSTVTKLDKVYSASAAEDHRQLLNQSSSMIGKHVRGYLTRQRVRAGLRALRTWRRRKARALLKEFQKAAERYFLIEEEVQQIETSRKIRIMTKAFDGWHVYAAGCRPAREERARKAEEMAERRRNAEIRKIILSWNKMAHGPSSRKAVMADYKRRRDRARENLSDAEQHQLITQKMVRKEMNLRAINYMRNRSRGLVGERHFRALRDLVVMPLRQKFKQAREHHLFTVYSKTWRKWKSWMRMSAAGLFRNEWEKPVDFKPKHNYRKYVLFHQTNVKRKVVSAWGRRAHIHAQVRKRFIAITTTRCLRHLRAWHARAKLQRQQKQLCIEEWREYGKRLLLTPFRAWYVFSSESRKKRVVDNTLLSAFLRRKKRMLLYSKFKLWAHQAIYGKVESMHTRLELVRVIDEQKRFCKALEEALRVKTEALDLSDENLKAEIERSEVAHAKMMDLKRDIMKREMAIHNMEQDNIRLQSLLDSISLIHPGTTKQLKRIEAAKRFKDRGFTALARIGVARKYHPRKDPRELEPLASNSPLKRLPDPVRRRPHSARPLGRYAGEPMGEGEDPVAFLVSRSSPSGPTSPPSRSSKTNVALMDRSDAGIVLRAKWASDRLLDLQGEIEKMRKATTIPGEQVAQTSSRAHEMQTSDTKEHEKANDVGGENSDEEEKLAQEALEISEGTLAERLGSVLQFVISGSIKDMIEDPFFPIKIEKSGENEDIGQHKGVGAISDREEEEQKGPRGDSALEGFEGKEGRVGKGLENLGMSRDTSGASNGRAGIASRPRTFTLKTAIRDNKTWGSFLSRLVMDYPVGHLGNLNTRDLITERVAKSERKMEKNRAERAKGVADRLNVFSQTAGL